MTAHNNTSPASCEHCGYIITRVKDTGVGMRKEVVQKLFKLFEMAQKSNALSKGGIITTQGIGLGLSISKQLVEILGGIIRINTAPNQGTEVKFVIPFMCNSCMVTY
jgi:signal transduction histidine kinase